MATMKSISFGIEAGRLVARISAGQFDTSLPIWLSLRSIYDTIDTAQFDALASSSNVLRVMTSSGATRTLRLSRDQVPPGELPSDYAWHHYRVVLGESTAHALAEEKSITLMLNLPPAIAGESIEGALHLMPTNAGDHPTRSTSGAFLHAGETLISDERHRIVEGRQIAEALDEPQRTDGNSSSGVSISTQPIAPWVTIKGYRILREIARGGQGAVFEATQQATGRRVAIKVLHGGGLVDAKHRARFEREVKILAALDHPNIVRIIDRGELPDGTLYLAMDLIVGRPLDQHLDFYYDRIRRGPPPKDPSELLKLFLKIADAVNCAHLRGVTHRDLKPSNIMVDDRGEPHILDFGLARPGIGFNTDTSEITVDGHFVGTPQWTSPEQAAGKSDVDARTDVYALGLILYQMLTRKFPYKVAGAMHEVLNAIMNSQPLPPSQAVAAAQEAQSRKRSFFSRDRASINPALESVILKSLAKRREDRYSSAGEFARDVENYLAGRPGTALVQQAAARWRIGVASAAVVVAVAGIVGIALWYQSAAEATKTPPKHTGTTAGEKPVKGPLVKPPEDSQVTSGLNAHANSSTTVALPSPPPAVVPPGPPPMPIDHPGENDAPACNGVNPMPPIAAGDANNAGFKIADLIKRRISDPDGPEEGVLVLRASSTDGQWQFTLDGVRWYPFDDPWNIGAVPLVADNRIRFVPNPGFKGVARGLRVCAWDHADNKTPGRPLYPGKDTGQDFKGGGTSAFSIDKFEVTVTVQEPKGQHE